MTKVENAARLAYFERWADPIAERVLADRPGIDLRRLEYETPESENWQVMGRVHGYQISARGDIREPWFGDRSLLERCPHLLAISSTGAGYDTIDVPECTAAGVLVCNQQGTNRESVAEHALGMMLALSKMIVETDKQLRRPGHVDRFAKLGTEIHGKTLGIIGIGTIGSRVSELCNGLFRMRVIAYDPYLDAAAIAGHGAQKVGMDELLAEADYVTVHCPRTDETMGMMGKPQFDAMKPSAFFINTARGGIHDEAALADALREGRIAGAGLDVFLKEPPAHDHPLMKFDNVMVSPHIAGITVEATRNMAESAALQWITLFEGAIPPRLINPEAWPRYQERFQEEFGFRPPDLPGKGGRAAR